jgi:crotonobetainyl-CoA:carnitine CoA-transferase CaiB-like acyl-CoA transferase
MKLCQDNRVPCVPIYDIAEVVNHRQIKAMDFFVELDHPAAGKLIYPKGPCTFAKTNWEWHKAAPLLGEDNENVYEGLGYTKKELTAMKKSGVI